jgi:phospholipid/cholesterol/gamma-HCH transport system permease protein
MPSKDKGNSGASVVAHTSRGGELTLRFSGRLDSKTTGDLWRETMQTLEGKASGRVIVEAGEIKYCDGSGLGLLFELRLLGQSRGFTVEIRNLGEEFSSLLDIFEPVKFAKETDFKAQPLRTLETVGKSTTQAVHDINELVIFIGHLCVEMVHTVLHPRHLRWKDALLAAERAGANAVGIVALLGFLFGLIMAFSSAMPLRQFGVEVYVSDLVAMALVRVLGPFITAIIMAGRTSSSFAAELGTMKVNDEVDALTTMGLEPMRFLVVPRVWATVVVTPLLTVLANVAGLVGSGIVILILGFPLITYTNHIKSSIDSGDVFAGLFKSVVYGGLVGAIGCLRGLETKGGASSVGISTTRAVVSGIIMIVITEGMFAVLYHYLGI